MMHFLFYHDATRAIPTISSDSNQMIHSSADLEADPQLQWSPQDEHFAVSFSCQRGDTNETTEPMRNQAPANLLKSAEETEGAHLSTVDMSKNLCLRISDTDRVTALCRVE